MMGIEPRHNPRLWGGGPGAQKHTHTTPGHPTGIQDNDLFHTSIRIKSVTVTPVRFSLSEKHRTVFSVERR